MQIQQQESRYGTINIEGEEELQKDNFYTLIVHMEEDIEDDFRNRIAVS